MSPDQGYTARPWRNKLGLFRPPPHRRGGALPEIKSQISVEFSVWGKIWYMIL